MIRVFLPMLVTLLLSSKVFAQEMPEHAEKKPPAKPGLPVSQVQNLPVIVEWKKWEKEHENRLLAVWGENISDVEGQKCWEVAFGELRSDGVRVWRQFCVPVAGGDIWVEKTMVHPDDDPVYMIYDKWVNECKPTADSQGNC